jgi:hypothetical protein
MQCLKSLALALLLFVAMPAFAGEERLTGSGDGRPPAFTVDGPWLAEWSTTSEYPQLATIEIRLYDADNDEYLGKVAELKGTGNGVKLFESPGTYQFVIVGKFVDWDIRIYEVDAERAAEMRRKAEGRSTTLDLSRQATRLVPESSFESWRPEGDDTLLLFRDGTLSWTIRFDPPCPGLGSATALSFMAHSMERGVEQYDSILLDDGRQCHFSSVAPGHMN